MRALVRLSAVVAGLLVAAATGPAFANRRDPAGFPAWPNFAAIQEWNKSAIYSKTIALFATRLADDQ